MGYPADGGRPPPNSGSPPATLNSPQAATAVTFMRSLVTTGVTPSAITTFQEKDAMNTFANGDAAFLRNWDYAYSTATTPATSKLTARHVGGAPLPTFSGQPYPA